MAVLTLNTDPNWLENFGCISEVRGVNRNACLRDKLLNGELFCSPKKAQVIIESLRRPYNGVRPHTSLGYQPPASETWVSSRNARPSALVHAAPTATLSLAIRPTLH
jgi:hypothetical protein